jgi:hypothetical protein
MVALLAVEGSARFTLPAPFAIALGAAVPAVAAFSPSHCGTRLSWVAMESELEGGGERGQGLLVLRSSNRIPRVT